MSYRVKVAGIDCEDDSRPIRGVWFQFNELCDAVAFVETCMECGDEGTIVLIKKEVED